VPVKKEKVPEKLTSPAEREKGNGSHVMDAHLQKVLPSQEKNSQKRRFRRKISLICTHQKRTKISPVSMASFSRICIHFNQSLCAKA
jgi:hypothetical protein